MDDASKGYDTGVAGRDLAIGRSHQPCFGFHSSALDRACSGGVLTLPEANTRSCSVGGESVQTGGGIVTGRVVGVFSARLERCLCFV